MSDIDTIKSRIRKLMAVAGDGVATDGEIDNAMRLAAKLLDAHHLTSEDIEAHPDEKDPEIGEAFATSQSTRFSTWESLLASAITRLFGCVQYYITNESAPIRINGIAVIDGGAVRRGKKLCFYGPLTESKEAAELCQEWSRAIATMGVARWGGCFRGDGAMYCYGFAAALFEKASEINKERELVMAKPLAQLGLQSNSTAITLSNRYELLRDRGDEWLKKEKGVNLEKSGGRSGYRSGSNEAFSEGRAHGAKADFQRTTKRPQLSHTK